MVEEIQSCFDCKICLETPRDPVLTLCGHLYCWPCLYHWIHYKNQFTCPMCKEEVIEMDVVPIYGCDGSSGPRAELGFTVPPRPHAHRLKRSNKRILRCPMPSTVMVPTIARYRASRLSEAERTEDRDSVLRTIATDTVGSGSGPTVEIVPTISNIDREYQLVEELFRDIFENSS